MRSVEDSPAPVPAPGRPGPAVRQEDEHSGFVAQDLDSTPVVVLDWSGLIEGGTTPCLALGAERRTRKRD